MRNSRCLLLNAGGQRRIDNLDDLYEANRYVQPLSRMNEVLSVNAQKITKNTYLSDAKLFSDYCSAFEPNVSLQ